MDNKPNFSKLIFILFFVLSCPAFSQSELPLETNSTHQCADQIKSKMKRLDLSLQDTSDAEWNKLIQSFNSLISSKVFSKKIYLMESEKGKHESISKLSFLESYSYENIGITILFNLSKPKKDGSHIFGFEIIIERINALDAPKPSSDQLAQEFLINEDCTFDLVRTIHTIKTAHESEVEFLESVHHTDENLASMTRSAKSSLPIDAILTNHFSDVFDKLRQSNISDTEIALEENSVCYMFGTFEIPLLKILFTLPQNRISEYFYPISKNNEKFYNVTMNYLLNDDRILITADLLYSLNKTSFVIIINGQEIWQLDEAYWNTAYVDSIKTKQRSLEVDLDLFFLNIPLEIDLMINSNLDYPNLHNYWKELSKKPLEEGIDGWKMQYHLESKFWTAKEDADPLVENPETSSNPFLKETEAIQISDPTVQALLNELREFKHLNRIDMAQKILEVVQKNLTIQTIIEGIYSLNTSDILKRKKVVCQHFANLFMTLSRGMGIPARMVLGYFIFSNEGLELGHAWNEIEIREGVWMPVEPQSSSLQLNTANYLPITDGAFFETLKVDNEEIIPSTNKITKLKFHLKLLPISSDRQEIEIQAETLK